ALTLMAKERGGIPLVQQVLFYPVTDANFDTGSYHQFATGYFLRRDGMQWFWDQYTTDEAERAPVHRLPAARHHRAAQGPAPGPGHHRRGRRVAGEGEAYANKLRQAGVPVTAVRFQGIIHDFVMLNALRETHAAQAAIAQAIATLRAALGTA
ncbi:alpha/beta hydrolase fold domain-containing protein, partial [Streptomyces sp. KR55]|uniref:alpha/beta hydrolase fold domain-containing protein n=1 Tax=Streptomyces sp. KR55 TaxID=3457425 RepID=UPI003FD2B582